MTDVYCQCCGIAMQDEGYQKNVVRGFKFQIGSCPNNIMPCPQFGRTYSIGPNIPFSQEEMADRALFLAELGKRSEVRGEAVAEPV